MITPSLTLQALSMELPTLRETHPNRVPFTGVLTRLEEPSDRAPHGAQQHRVLLTKAAAAQALWSLIGMAVNFDAHTQRGHLVKSKVGIITAAHVRGQDLVVAGYLFGKDFPTEVLAIQAGSRDGRLGMSFEITNVQVADPLAPVWRIERCLFTGAAILERNAAAYGNTSIAAQAAGKDGFSMDNVRAFDDVLAQLRAQRDQLAALLSPDPPVVPAGGAGSVQAEHADVPPKHSAKKADRRTMLCNMANSIMKRLASEHDDEKEDTALFQRLMRQMMGMEDAASAFAQADDPLALLVQAMEAGTGTDSEEETMNTLFLMQLAQQQNKQVQTQMTELAASMSAMSKLLTDTVTQQTGLITDLKQQVAGLITDQAALKAAAAAPPAPVASAAPPAAVLVPTVQAQTPTDPPVRVTFTNGQHNWANKLALDAGQTYTEAAIDRAFKDHGITDIEQRIAIKMDLRAQGVLQ